MRLNKNGCPVRPAPVFFIGLIGLIGVSAGAAESPPESYPWAGLPAISSRTAATAHGGVQYWCGQCHTVPHPNNLPQKDWDRILANMRGLMALRQLHPPEADWAAIRDYFAKNAPEHLSFPEPVPASALVFHPEPLGEASTFDAAQRASHRNPPPMIGGLRIMNLDADPGLEILVCDGVKGEVRALDLEKKGPGKERVLARILFPVEPHATDLDGDGQEDLLVAGLGRLLQPGDDLVGSVWYLGRRPQGDEWFGRALMSRMPRVASVVSGDLNRDNRVDVVFAAYGWRTAGAVGVLLQEKKGGFRLKQLSKSVGVSHLQLGDFNRDGLTDVAGLVSQEHERVVIWWNEGGEVFREETVFEAGTPSFGASGLRSRDMDGDGDADLLLWNGDGLDGTGPKPYHGIAWLENTGLGIFHWHDLIRWPGVYGVVPTDLDGDGDVDLVACSQSNVWDDPERWSLVWLENRGPGQWHASGLGKSPTHLGVIDAGDIDGDGTVEIITGGLHVMPPFDRTGRITLWKRQQDKQPATD